MGRYTPTTFLPGNAAVAHAATQYNSQTLGTNYIGYGLAAPTTGRYNAGDLIYNTAPTTGGFIRWVCVTAGTPALGKSSGQSRLEGYPSE
jgi:hypothetical protein